MLSVLDIFRIGIGPSSSHTVGPMRIARRFVRALGKSGALDKVARVTVELQGSLALTGIGHGTVDASILGLAGFAPDRTDPDEAAEALRRIEVDKCLSLGGQRRIGFDRARDIDLAGHIIPVLHPNGMVLRGFEGAGRLFMEETYYSVGGGFVVTDTELEAIKHELHKIGVNINQIAFAANTRKIKLAKGEMHALDDLRLVMPRVRTFLQAVVAEQRRRGVRLFKAFVEAEA